MSSNWVEGGAADWVELTPEEIALAENRLKYMVTGQDVGKVIGENIPSPLPNTVYELTVKDPGCHTIRYRFGRDDNGQYRLEEVIVEGMNS